MKVWSPLQIPPNPNGEGQFCPETLFPRGRSLDKAPVTRVSRDRNDLTHLPPSALKGKKRGRKNSGILHLLNSRLEEDRAISAELDRVTGPAHR